MSASRMPNSAVASSDNVFSLMSPALQAGATGYLCTPTTSKIQNIDIGTSVLSLVDI